MKLAFRPFALLTLVLGALIVASGVASANHAWGNYHWARTSNPFTLKLGDNVSAAWDSYLATTSSDWSVSSVLDTTIVAGGGGRNCRPTSGRVEVCNRTYGYNGWLGVAQIWASGSHITQGTVKVNDSYFNTSTYNTPAWRQFVMCQEIGHTFGLDHQDETNNNANLGSCMDYTNDPDGGAGGASPNDPANTAPNAHDFAQLETIYSHFDGSTTIGQIAPRGNGNNTNLDDPSAWGRIVRSSGNGRSVLYERDFGGGNKVFTFVIWAQ